MINIAVVGTGYWGKNLVRNFNELSDSNLYVCCDLNADLLKTIQHLCPNTKVTQSFDEVIDDGKVDAVAIATSARTHFELARKALLADKHVLVEKPMTLRSADAVELIKLAQERNKKLMVGHLLLYHPAVDKLKQIVDSGELGNIYYIYSQRINLGRIRRDENALWSFAPHDLSVILHLLEEEPTRVVAVGESYLQDGISDVVFVYLRFNEKQMAQLQLSWLDPHKIRKITIVGSKKMTVFDDVEGTEKLKIYDKGVDGLNYASYGDSLTLRFGDIYIPKVNMAEPLKLECQHFLDCIREDKDPRTDGRNGLRVVKVLEAAQESLHGNGSPVDL